MPRPPKILMANYTYNLPESRIAQFPVDIRDHSKLLIYKNGEVENDAFYSLPNHLPENAMLVFNDSKVINARLQMSKETGAKIEFFCLGPNKMELTKALAQKGKALWRCMIGNASKLKDHVAKLDLDEIHLSAQVVEKLEGEFIVEFSWTPSEFSFAEILEKAGKLPLPPYMHREAKDEDNISYQTVYSKTLGAVAAPTAGLHFTAQTFIDLAERNIKMQFLTLQVGAGTFLPVKSEDAQGHAMHEEEFIVPLSVIQEISQHNGPLIPVGTTAIRTIESLFVANERIIQGKKHNYRYP